MDGFKVANLGGNVTDIGDSQGKPLFKRVTVEWTTPLEWCPGGSAPTGLAEDAPGHLYVIVRDHHASAQRETIAYVGLTNSVHTRFYQHPKAKSLAEKRGKTLLSIGNIDFGDYRTAYRNNKEALEELEHIFIWTLWPTLDNEMKMFTLPGMGENRGRAWHIVNTGHRFHGRMPMEIVFPWLLVKPGRDCSARRE